MLIEEEIGTRREAKKNLWLIRRQNFKPSWYTCQLSSMSLIGKMCLSKAATIFCVLTFFCFVLKIAVSSSVDLISQRENVCGTWLPYKDEKCIKVIQNVKYDQESGASICKSFSEVFDTDYSLLRIRNKDEQGFFSQLLFKEHGIQKSVWLEYKVKENKIVVPTRNDHSNLMNLKVHFNNWANIDQGEKNGMCVQMLPEINGTNAGLWERVNCNELNIVVCERPQPVTMESLQAKHQQLENMIQLLLKHEHTSKETVKGVKLINIARGKPVQQSSTYTGSHAASNAIDGNTGTQAHTAPGDRYPWWRVDLLRPYAVHAVSIYSVPTFEERFHDVSIVVSNTDVSTAPPKTYFNPGNNSVCVDNIASESAVNPGWNTFNCKQVLLGRYVSLQITADCYPGRNDCNHPNDRHYEPHFQLLAMMEVEIYAPWHHG